MVKKRVKLAVLLLCSLWLVGRGVLHLAQGSESETSAGSHNLIGMLSQISDTNAELGKTNQGIVDHMKVIDQQTGKTGEVAKKLGEVQQGLASQNDTLADLVPVTGDQVALSTTLRNLSTQIHESMKHIEQTSAAQKRELQKLREIVRRANTQVTQAAAGNSQILTELEKAEKKSRIIEQAIP